LAPQSGLKLTPLDYFKEVVWDDSFAQDRFFAYADIKLRDQVVFAAQRGLFRPEVGAQLFHPGATSSYKQIQFGDVNLRLTFHENDTRAIDGAQCIKVESDMDYHRDLGAHALLEVVANAVTGSLTDPKVVYQLRWIAGRRAGFPKFNPPYTVR